MKVTQSVFVFSFVTFVFWLNQITEFEWNEREIATEDFYNLHGQCIFLLFKFVLCFQTLFLFITLYLFCYVLSSKSKPIRAILHLVILADAVFEIFPSCALRYMGDFGSAFEVNCLPGRVCFNFVTTNTIADASRSFSILSNFVPVESISWRYSPTISQKR